MVVDVTSPLRLCNLLCPPVSLSLCFLMLPACCMQMLSTAVRALYDVLEACGASLSLSSSPSHPSPSGSSSSSSSRYDRCVYKNHVAPLISALQRLLSWGVIHRPTWNSTATASTPSYRAPPSPSPSVAGSMMGQGQCSTFCVISFHFLLGSSPFGRVFPFSLLAEAFKATYFPLHGSFVFLNCSANSSACIVPPFPRCSVSFFPLVYSPWL